MPWAGSADASEGSSREPRGRLRAGLAWAQDARVSRARAPAACLAALSACAAPTAQDPSVDAGDTAEIPWARDPGSVAVTAPGAAAEGLCADEEDDGLAVLDSADAAMARYRLLFLDVFFQEVLSMTLEELVYYSVVDQGQADCLTFQQEEEDLLISSSRSCQLTWGLTWTGTHIREEHDALVSLSYDHVEVRYLDETLSMHGRTDALFEDPGLLHWETTMRWKLPEDRRGRFRVSGTGHEGLAGSTWSALSPDPLFEDPNGSGGHFWARARLDETEASREQGLATGTACGASSNDLSTLAIQGAELWELVERAEDGCYDTWRDGLVAGSWCRTGGT